jgi:hypothetical protein
MLALNISNPPTSLKAHKKQAQSFPNYSFLAPYSLALIELSVTKEGNSNFNQTNLFQFW